MNTRIRYSVNGDLLKSVKDFQHPSNGARYSVTINKVENSFIVVDEMSNDVVKTGSGTNLHQTKIAAKIALARLGISFESEKRNITRQSA